MKKSAYRPRDPAGGVLARGDRGRARNVVACPKTRPTSWPPFAWPWRALLRQMDRQRVRGYERIRTGRELPSVSEDVKGPGPLRARRARPAPAKRERLQTLLGKAIVAELGPLPSPDGTYSAATPGR